ncbi:MAG: endonuclease/exonuclease/phosphatase family protein [Candidatus Didemnitutus sp.]|nr:endonuclease/exonuclease/phosphatase family protein [Candidatus Didemnitutus sp.]
MPSTSVSRRTFVKGLAAASLLPLAPAAAPAQPRPAVPRTALPPGRINLLTANIRVALPEDEAAGIGWSQRRELCLDVIAAQQPDIVCYQETLWGQVEDLKARFRDYAFFGFEGPEMDGKLDGYHGIAKNVLMFACDRFEPVTCGGFWLSETPHLPGSMSWETARARHVNWVRLKERATGREFRVLTTHLDHKSQPARERQTRLIVDEAALYADTFPQLLAGDFNARLANPLMEIIRSGGWKDTYEEVHGPGDPGFTTHRFLGEAYPASLAPRQPPGRIDFIFSRGPVKTLASRIVKDSRDGRYPSDHYFLSAQVELTA